MHEEKKKKMPCSVVIKNGHDEFVIRLKQKHKYGGSFRLPYFTGGGGVASARDINKVLLETINGQIAMSIQAHLSKVN